MQNHKYSICRLCRSPAHLEDECASRIDLIDLNDIGSSLEQTSPADPKAQTIASRLNAPEASGRESHLLIDFEAPSEDDALRASYARDLDQAIKLSLADQYMTAIARNGDTFTQQLVPTEEESTKFDILSEDGDAQLLKSRSEKKVLGWDDGLKTKQESIHNNKSLVKVKGKDKDLHLVVNKDNRDVLSEVRPNGTKEEQNNQQQKDDPLTTMITIEEKKAKEKVPQSSLLALEQRQSSLPKSCDNSIAQRHPVDRLFNEGSNPYTASARCRRRQGRRSRYP